MQQEIEFLKNKYPDKTIWPSLDKNYICVRTILGTSNFGKLPNGDKIEVPITNTERVHVDTVRLMMIPESPILHERPEYCKICDRYFN